MDTMKNYHDVTNVSPKVSSYHVTTVLSAVEIDLFTQAASKQDEKVLAFFRANPHLSFSPSDVWRTAFTDTTPITSVRRAMSNLTEAGLLVKIENVTKTGLYGKPEHLWRVR
jgi:predicted component of type VI protein secretion system